MYLILKMKHLAFGVLVGVVLLGVLCGVLFWPSEAYGESGPPRVFLTFDDGPSHNTADVLDVLAQEGVKGTFFVIGRTEEWEKQLYRRIVEEGHAIGLHTYSHKTSEVYRSLDAFVRDFRKIESWITEITGETPKICRMPGGTYTRQCPASLRKQILAFFDNEGYACFDWDIDPLDSGGYALPADRLAYAVVRDAKKLKDKDVVVLMHDDGLRTTLAKALPGIIQYFREQGYEFKILEEDLQLVSRRE